ncbi:MAG: sulfur oxidation c-type cytochrome SoxA [Sulfuricella sp.]|nr:sulfur oxidation c-type cytochrome SoxA [Sulfuricella sp.]
MKKVRTLPQAVGSGALVALLAAVALSAPPVLADEAPVEKDAATLEFERFRAEMEEFGPSGLWEDKGEQLWKTARGPKNVALADKCDLGLGPGVVSGAYVQMPRYFPDADKVMDAERRIVWCMVNLQGFKEEEITKKPFAKEGQDTPEQTSLVTYVAGQSRDLKIAVPQKHPKEIAAYKIGKEITGYRAGPYDFSCLSCHGEVGKRIRMQNLPNIATPEGALQSFQGWPGYRMTGGVMLTQQWRMNDCFRQQRFPQPKYISDSITALLTYLTANANGQVYKGPGIKR